MTNYKQSKNKKEKKKEKRQRKINKIKKPDYKKEIEYADPIYDLFGELLYCLSLKWCIIHS